MLVGDAEGAGCGGEKAGPPGRQRSFGTSAVANAITPDRTSLTVFPIPTDRWSVSRRAPIFTYNSA